MRKPRVAFVSTGDELTDPGPALKPGQIRDANSYALSAAARLAGAEVISRAKVGDDRDETIAALRTAIDGADILCTIGGVSVGPHDHVRPALAALGAREIFGRVSLRPGGQICFFVAEDGTLCFALPGNPVSATISFRLFVVAALDALLGRGRAERRTTATAAVDLPGRIGRTTAVRCRAELRPDGWYVAPSQSHQDSHVLTSLLDIDALRVRARGPRVAVGGRDGRRRVRALSLAQPRFGAARRRRRREQLVEHERLAADDRRQRAVPHEVAPVLQAALERRRHRRAREPDRARERERRADEAAHVVGVVRVEQARGGAQHARRAAAATSAAGGSASTAAW